MQNAGFAVDIIQQFIVSLCCSKKTHMQKTVDIPRGKERGSCSHAFISCLLGMCSLCVSCMSQSRLDMEIQVPDNQQFIMAMAPSQFHMNHFETDKKKDVFFHWRIVDFWVEKSELKSGHLSLRVPDELNDASIGIEVYKKNNKGNFEEVCSESFEPKNTKRIRVSEDGITIEKR